MKRFPKLIVTLLLLAMVIGIFAAMPVAAASDYQVYRIKSAQITVGYYPDLSMTGEPVKNSANPIYTKEVACLIDNDNNSAFWSTPFKFKDFKDQGGTKVPVVLIDVANGGEGVAISAYDMRLRSYFDCMPLHFELQATTSAGSDNWTTLVKKSGLTWDSISQRFEFPETTVYKVRILFYDIGDANISDDSGMYETLLGDETRFSLAEIDLLQKKEGDSTGNTGTTPKPTTPGGQGTTRPGILFPTKPVGGQTTTQPATKAPTQPATKAPTQPATQAPTKAPGTQTTTPATKAPTQPATQAPTKAPGTQTTTPVATQPGTVAPTEPTGTVDPSAPTEPTGTVDPSAPTEPTGTVDPSAPTDEPTEEPTVAPTVEATEPEATTPATDNGTEEQPDNTWIIIVAIVAAAAIAGGAIFFIIKKKKG